MRGRLAIRTRLAIVSATLAVGVLAAGLLTVYLIDRRQVDQTLTTAAHRAAADLAAAGLRDGVPPASAPTTPAGNDGGESAQESDDEVLGAYLKARQGSGQLLASVSPGGRRRANSLLARRLWLREDVAPGHTRRIEIAGEEYVLAAASRGRGRVFAAVPAAEAEAGVRTLLDAMLIVCLVGLIPATRSRLARDAAGACAPFAHGPPRVACHRRRPVGEDGAGAVA